MTAALSIFAGVLSAPVLLMFYTRLRRAEMDLVEDDDGSGYEEVATCHLRPTPSEVSS